MDQYVLALIGGMVIGLAGLLLLLFDGRVMGVSGIVGGIFARPRESWRLAFLAGIFAGGLLIAWNRPDRFTNSLDRSAIALLAAGLLVGYGTRLGGGCTSGHGICGISRLSSRSIIATLLFMAAGALTVFVIRHGFGGKI